MSDSDLNRINQTEQTELSEANQAETFKNSSTAKIKDNSTGNDVIFAQETVENPSNVLKQKDSVNKETNQISNENQVPLIIVQPGLGPKKSQASKNASTGVLKAPSAKTTKKLGIKHLHKISDHNEDDDDDDDEEMINDSDRDGNIIDYNSNDEYMPPKMMRDTGSDGSDVEVSVKRKSARLSKKPKMLEEYEVGESSNDTPFKHQQQLSGQITQLQELDNLPTSLSNKVQLTGYKATTKVAEPQLQQQQQNQLTGLSNQPKQFARKSTAPGGNILSNSNQNYINNQQQPIPKRNTPIRYVASAAPASKLPVLTQIANGTSNQNNATHINPVITNSKLTPPNNVDTISSTSVSSSTSSTNTAVQPAIKQFRNKIISCKPFCESKATTCSPIVKDASTQVDLDELVMNHTIVPVPVPIHVPVPMCMYQAAMPVPILVPIPIPVPIFIPTTKKTFDRVERKIQKLRKKLPSDPYEFEILLYAEKLAREEGIEGFEESSDGESDLEPMVTSNTLKLTKLNSKFDQEESNKSLNQSNLEKTNQMIQNEQEGTFKWVYGVKIFNPWLQSKIETIRNKTSALQRLPDDLIKLKNDELNILLAEFVHEIRKPTGEVYAPESVYYLCLGIQYYLQEKGRVENIFLDYHLFEKFQESLNEIALRYQIRINTEGHITSRIEEEILWESKQLGAFSPFVLLNTILYFNTKYFFLDKPESHLQLSFTNVKKHSKRNIGPNGEDYGKTVFLRYYPDFHGLEQVIYEQGENFDNPLRCPVELYNFYLSKCPENVKNRNDVFYLLPEKSSLPSSPVWFSSQPMSPKMLERMLNRIKMVREVNELLIAASPATSSAIIG